MIRTIILCAAIASFAATVALAIFAGDTRSIGAANIGHTYTLDADFDQGALLNVNHTAPGTNQLQLDTTTSTFPFVNIAASARGTAIRINVDTGGISGEYLTAPDGMGRDPSRTTVDQLGNVWVANRAEYGISGGESKGSVARIGLTVGGTRSDADGTPNPGGQYLAPPFSYNTCVDANGDNLIKTSSGLGNILPWTNAASADADGGVSTAEDECIINYTRVTGTGTRTVAIDGNNDIWVGGLGDRDHEKLDGLTGQPVPGTQFNLGCGGYGGLIDQNGVLWSARELLRFVPNATPPPAGVGTCYPDDRGDYGLGIGPNGHIWSSSLFSSGVDGACCRLYELDANGNVLHSYLQPFGAQGVVVDGNNHVWMAEAFGSQVWHLAPDPGDPSQHISIGIVPGFLGTTGVAVDANGKIWASEISDRASRIDPAAGPIGGGGVPVGAIDLSVDLGPGAGPYNYSDMTGFVIGTTAPQGKWTVVFDSQEVGAEWGTISWNTENASPCPADAADREPPGTSITARARTAETQAGLAAESYITATNGTDINPPNGRYIELEMKLTPNAANDGPILCDVTVGGAGVAEGRMTGGGSVSSGGIKATFGTELHCAAGAPPNNLEVNWGKGNGFHLESLTSVTCSDDAAITSTPPAAPFDTLVAEGIGRCNGVSGAKIKVTFTDQGEPGKNDTAKIDITGCPPTVSLSVSGTLTNGNLQAHKP